MCAALTEVSISSFENQLQVVKMFASAKLKQLYCFFLSLWCLIPWYYFKVTLNSVCYSCLIRMYSISIRLCLSTWSFESLFRLQKSDWHPQRQGHGMPICWQSKGREKLESTGNKFDFHLNRFFLNLLQGDEVECWHGWLTAAWWLQVSPQS